jgi:hypothetical protein
MPQVAKGDVEADVPTWLPHHRRPSFVSIAQPLKIHVTGTARHIPMAVSASAYIIRIRTMVSTIKGSSDKMGCGVGYW